MVMPTPVGRRRFVKGPAATTAIAAGAPIFKPFLAAGATEIVHWSWLGASDGEVWAQMIKNYNDANKDAPIRMELVPEEQYMTKILAAAATGTAPDFGFGTAGQHAQFAHDDVTVPLDDLAKNVGLDLADFSDFSIKASRYPKYDNKLFMVPMDLMSLQPEINTDH